MNLEPQKEWNQYKENCGFQYEEPAEVYKAQKVTIAMGIAQLAKSLKKQED